MKRFINKEEADSLTPEEVSYSRPRKVEFALLDPTGVEIDRHEFFYRGPEGMRILLTIDGHPHYFGMNGVYRGEPGGDSRPDVCYCGEKMVARQNPEYICMNPLCDYYCKIRPNFIEKVNNWVEKKQEVLKKNAKDLNDDNLFVIQYQAMVHAHVYFTGDSLDNAKKFLKENEGRYLKLTNKTWI